MSGEDMARSYILSEHVKLEISRTPIALSIHKVVTKVCSILHLEVALVRQ